jgi:iron complex outermembrane recepter protein
MMKRAIPWLTILSVTLGVATSASEQANFSPDATERTEPIVVTATRVDRAASFVPASIDVIDADRIHNGQLQVNLSETLQTLPGVVANNRQNYAQDLQISIRGFGARSTFGVRGVRVIVDGIPATMPDGQAQVSHIDLASADRIEVLRGPFSVLYGNSSGGVINVFTGDGPQGLHANPSIALGSDGIRRYGVRVGANEGRFAYNVSLGRFETEGYRDHSAATRSGANAKARYDLTPQTTLTLVGNVLDMPEIQDPLGLARAQFEANPRPVDPSAIQFNTRKRVDQQQAGLSLDHDFGEGHAARLSVYAGRRGSQQFQAIPVAPQLNPLHPGGVIDLDRNYSGIDAHWSWQGRLGGDPVTVVAGLDANRLLEDRRGFQNFVDTQLGVLGALRRDETNRVVESGQYVQAEWSVADAVTVLAGARVSRIPFDSSDHYVTAKNPDDSGHTDFNATTPVAGVTWRAMPSLSLYAAAGRGFETPTLNELAYRPDGGSGLNLNLRAAKSDNFEIGAKWIEAAGWRATAAVYRVDTLNEIVVQTNSGGRSTYRNAGKTRREGIELLLNKSWRGDLGFSAAFTSLKATYRDAFLVCGAAACNTPTTTVLAGNRIPGVPNTTAYAELRWLLAPAVEMALEARHSGTMKVNDINVDAAPAYTVANLRLGATWRKGGLVARPFVRIDNLFDRRYVGSVIVNEANARYFEPAPGRTFLAGIAIDSPF